MTINGILFLNLFAYMELCNVIKDVLKLIIFFITLILLQNFIELFS